MSQPLPNAPDRYSQQDQNQTRLLMEQELSRLRAMVEELRRRLAAAGIP